MQWNHHGQIDFIFHTTDAVRNLTADVQCGGYRGSGTFQRKSGARSGGFDNGTDQCVYQSFHRNLIGSKCTCSEILCGRKNKRNVGDGTYGYCTCSGKRSGDGGCYAKVINLDKESEPDIYGAITRDALLENVTVAKDGIVMISNEDAKLYAKLREEQPEGLIRANKNKEEQ